MLNSVGNLCRDLTNVIVSVEDLEIHSSDLLFSVGHLKSGLTDMLNSVGNLGGDLTNILVLVEHLEIHSSVILCSVEDLERDTTDILCSVEELKSESTYILISALLGIPWIIDTNKFVHRKKHRKYLIERYIFKFAIFLYYNIICIYYFCRLNIVRFMIIRIGSKNWIVSKINQILFWVGAKTYLNAKKKISESLLIDFPWMGQG